MMCGTPSNQPDSALALLRQKGLGGEGLREAIRKREATLADITGYALDT